MRSDFLSRSPPFPNRPKTFGTHPGPANRIISSFSLLCLIVSKYPSYHAAGLVEEVEGGGEVEGIGEAGEAETKDKKVQEPEK